MDTVKKTAAAWYKKLGFPHEYDEEFYKLLNETEGFYEMPFSDFKLDEHKDDDERNAVWSLYFCEEVSLKYKERSIPEEIMLDTLSDIRDRIMWYTDRVGKMGNDKLCDWLYLSLRFENFKLGRLQYQFRGAGLDSPEHALKKGEPVLAVHIPRGEKLTEEAALESFAFAESFFEKYFPEYKYRAFTCCSWLLDNTLEKFLSPESNILKFAALFDIVYYDHGSYDSLTFAFPYGTTRDNLKDFIPTTSLQAKIRTHVLAGGDMTMGYGVREKSTK